MAERELYNTKTYLNYNMLETIYRPRWTGQIPGPSQAELTCSVKQPGPAHKQNTNSLDVLVKVICLLQGGTTCACMTLLHLWNLSLVVGFFVRAVKKASLSSRVSCLVETSSGGNQSGMVGHSQVMSPVALWSGTSGDRGG